MYTITKQFAFEASHQLPQLPPEHKCSRLHGHSYRVIVGLQRQTLDSNGFVIDYGDLKPFAEYLTLTLDHRHLNDVLNVAPTAENIACHLFYVAYKYWGRLVAFVRVSETGNTWAEFRETYD